MRYSLVAVAILTCVCHAARADGLLEATTTRIVAIRAYMLVPNACGVVPVS
jgi:hypothetical protein